MTKAEMENHWTLYGAALAEARRLIQQGEYAKAIAIAITGWEHIDGAQQYERKYCGREPAQIEAIDSILKLAPILLDFETLDKLDLFLKSQRKIEKNYSTDLSELRAIARAQLWQAHGLWDHLERHPNSRQDQLRASLGGDQEWWRWLAETWEKIGLILRIKDGGSFRLRFATLLEDTVLAKCPSCAAVAKAHKIKFLDSLTCPKCHSSVTFVLLASDETARV